MSGRADRGAAEPTPLSDPGSLALVAYGCDLVGVIFLANALSLRNPRRFLQEHFGVQPKQPLKAVHHQIKVKAQIFTGFLFLMVGFTIGFVSTVVETVPGDTGPADEPLRAVLLLVAGVLAVALGLRVAHNVWALAVFRRLLAEFFEVQADWEFEKHPATTREIGEILGVDGRGDDSIGEYSDRVRAALRLQVRGRSGGSGGVSDDAFAPLRNVGGDRRR